MRLRITVITVGVDHLERSLRFYRDGLGLPMQGIVGTETEYGMEQARAAGATTILPAHDTFWGGYAG